VPGVPPGRKGTLIDSDDLEKVGNWPRCSPGDRGSDKRGIRRLKVQTGWALKRKGCVGGDLSSMGRKRWSPKAKTWKGEVFPKKSATFLKDLPPLGERSEGDRERSPEEQ